MTDAGAEKNKSEKSAWNILFWAVVLVGGFFTLLGPCLYFRGFTESDPEYQFLRTHESPDGNYFADVFRYLPPDKKGAEALVVDENAPVPKVC